MSPLFLLVFNAAATWFMVGLIWFVQIVHYPMLERVGESGYQRYQETHMRLTTWVVAPPMLIEVLTGAALILSPPTGVPYVSIWLGFLLIVAIWICTATIQVPLHKKLADGFDARLHDKLVWTNWVRTGLWSVRGLLVGLIIFTWI